MAVLQATPFLTSRVYSKPYTALIPNNFSLSYKIMSLNPRRFTSALVCSFPNSLPSTEQEFLEAVSGSEEDLLPCIRSYENNLSRLTLVGSVDFEQAVTAAAADGGKTASEHIEADLPGMVVETVFPDLLSNHSVSTRLFLPAKKVKEKARNLRTLTEDILSSTTSENILALTFRQVVLQQLWSFELVFFKPGTARNMEDLGSPREVPPSFSLSSSDKRVISLLAEVVCLTSIESTKNNLNESSTGSAYFSFPRLVKSPKWVASKDLSFIIYRLFEGEIGGDVQTLLDKFNSVKKHHMAVEVKPNESWWTLSAYSKLEKVGGAEFSNWACEYLPAYMLQIDRDRIKDLKLEGWKNASENMWEVFLTHSQMLGLANIVDMYYEDVYTLPDKTFSCEMGVDSHKIFKTKKGFSLWKMLTRVFAGGLFMISIGVLSQLYFPRLVRGSNASKLPTSILSSEIHCPKLQLLESTEMEDICSVIVRKIKDGLGWCGDVMRDGEGGAWIGDPPSYLMKLSESEDGLEKKMSDIASYEVVLSSDGKLVGFQPTSRVGVNQWATNPLSSELYGGRKMSPWFLEPGLRIQQPGKIFVIELLMSTNPDTRFAFARQAPNFS